MNDAALLSSVFWIAFAYILGSCPTGYVIVKLLRGEDIRAFGSGNIGATNVSRVLGKKWAIITALIDMLKGGTAILIAIASGVESDALLALMGVAGVLGHDYPVWLGFKGGKGVATTYGVIACYGFFNPLPAIIGGLAWFLIREASRYVSLASMLSLAAAALVMPFFSMPKPYYAAGLFLALLTTWRHRENIVRLMSGKESKVARFFFR